MATWAELLSDIRYDLQDTAATKRWSDDLLHLYAKDGLRDYSMWFPKRVDRTQLISDSDGYMLPIDFIQDIYVECPADTYLERKEVRPGTRKPKRAKVLTYYSMGGRLYLNTPTEQPVLLTYFSAHAVPPAADAECTLTVPDTDLELIRLYVKAKAYSQMRSKQSALDRFKPTGGRDDNPLEPEVADLMRDYERGIAERIHGGMIVLYRIGRRK
jgi:hypothetical protein